MRLFRKKSAPRPPRNYREGEVDRSRAVNPIETMEALRTWMLPNSWRSDEWDRIKAHIAGMQLAVGGGEDVTFFYDIADADRRISERGREFIFDGMLEILKRDMDFQASRPRPDTDSVLASFYETPTATEEEREIFMLELDAKLALADLEAVTVRIEREEQAERERAEAYGAALERVALAWGSLSQDEAL